MSLYHFIARDASGKKFTGDVEVIDEKALITTLQTEGLVPIEIKRRDSVGRTFSKRFLPKILGGISASDVVGFTRQFSTMISAGLSITDSLVILEKQAKNHDFVHMLADVLGDVEGGTSLSQALSRHQEAFDIIYVKLIEAGEAGGVLDKVLIKLADNLEKEREFKAKTRGAFIYPVIVVSVMVIVMAVMMIFVIPKLTGLYVQIGAKLPLPTRILINTSDLMRSFWWLMLATVAATIWGLRIFAKTEKGAGMVSRFVFALPIWGKIRKMLMLAQFTRTLGLLIGTGIPIIAALKVVADILRSKTYKEGIEFAISRVERGSPLYLPLSSNSAFPPIVGQMV